MAIDRSQVAVVVCPCVPYVHVVPVQVADVRVASQEPEQLVDDGAQVEFLGRQTGEARGEVETHLVAEHAFRAGSRAVVLVHALLENVSEKIEVLLHESSRGGRKVETRRATEGRGECRENEEYVISARRDAVRKPEPQ